MSEKIIHFDLGKGKNLLLDVASMFPFSAVHPIRHTSVRYFIDDPYERRPTPNFSLKKDIQVSRFRTLSFLDLLSPDLVNTRPWQRKVLDIAPRPRILNLVPPLDIPHEALDLRDDVVIPKGKTYPDIFTRKLPYTLMVKRSVKETQGWTMTHRRGILAICATIIFMMIPIGFFVKYSVENGYNSLMNLRSVTNISEARSTLKIARDNFERANFLFFPISWLPGETINTADSAIQGGRLLSRGLSDILATFPNATGSISFLQKSENITPEYRASSLDIAPLVPFGIDAPTDWVTKNISTLDHAINDLDHAGNLYLKVATGSAITDKMHDIGVLLTRSMKYLEFATKYKKDLLPFFGSNEPIRYLVFNQNRDELRVNGGFPGSVILFTFYKGNILDLRRDDVYYYDWNLYPHKEIPPPGLSLITNNYGLRDVNYYPDFHETLEKANSFIERSGDSTITSAIAINQGMIEDILAKIGPVSVSGVTIPFDEKNFSLLMSTLVENQYAREHHPKDILFQFMTAMLEKVQEEHVYETVFDSVEGAWKQGEILFASRDQEQDDFIENFRNKLPWECVTGSGETLDGVSTEKGDSDMLCRENWIYPVFTSLSGNKSDRYITRVYSGSTTRLQGCTYENVITVSFSHTYKQSDTDILRSYMDQFGITNQEERSKLEFIEGNGKNKTFTRVYVPKSATLAFTGADIDLTEDDNAKIYAFTLETPVGATTSKTLRYTVDIPQCVTANTDLDWIRQPGIRELEIR